MNRQSATDRVYLSIDGTDCQVNQRFDRRFYSHKFKDSGVRYEVALCIKTGWICSIAGPYPAGEWPDINIFRDNLKTRLLPNELVEADLGYEGDEKVLDQDSCFNLVQWDMKCYVRSRHEHVNQRIKLFQVLNVPFRHRLSYTNLSKHKVCFDTAATIVQLNIQTFSPLAHVVYNQYV